MKLATVGETLATYLTLASALLLPLTMLLWARSYLVSDRLYRANAGWAVVAGCSNGELVVWAAPTLPELREYRHRSRETAWGWSNRNVFRRIGARETFWFLGFGHARGESLPWRGLALTGDAVAFVVPLWFINLVLGVMPARLLARNMQTSAEFLANRAAETTG